MPSLVLDLSHVVVQSELVLPTLICYEIQAASQTPTCYLLQIFSMQYYYAIFSLNIGHSPIITFLPVHHIICIIQLQEIKSDTIMPNMAWVVVFIDK